MSSGKYKSCETKNKKLIDYLYNIYIKENKYSKYIELFEMSIQEFVGYFSPFVKVPNLNEVDNAKDNKNCNIIESITQKVNDKLNNYLRKDDSINFQYKFKKNLLDFPSIIEDILKKEKEQYLKKFFISISFDFEFIVVLVKNLIIFYFGYF